MADYIASRPPIGSSTASLPPLHPSASPSLDNNNSNNNNNNNLAQATLSTPTVPFIQTSPEAWLVHAAQQRRHLSTGSFSSIASSTSILLSPDVNTPQSPTTLEFGESERIKDEAGQDNDDQEPELVLNVRPSELRASLMARAKRSSARMQQKRSESCWTSWIMVYQQ
ncbi:hypothetical protein BGX20_009756 [Mortierella sp. AD010]|nr:hypothetical protein BGX20_009756 [Mortierella sp. AD010]